MFLGLFFDCPHFKAHYHRKHIKTTSQASIKLHVFVEQCCMCCIVMMSTLLQLQYHAVVPLKVAITTTTHVMLMATLTAAICYRRVAL
jgi:hypothetical protein